MNFKGCSVTCSCGCSYLFSPPRCSVVRKSSLKLGSRGARYVAPAFPLRPEIGSNPICRDSIAECVFTSKLEGRANAMFLPAWAKSICVRDVSTHCTPSMFPKARNACVPTRTPPARKNPYSESLAITRRCLGKTAAHPKATALAAKGTRFCTAPGRSFSSISDLTASLSGPTYICLSLPDGSVYWKYQYLCPLIVLEENDPARSATVRICSVVRAASIN